ncbi:MAG: DEAD/DEAH box helicase [Roseibium sp.]|nr:DEAD/DEAH box helicase [Roseibium sp.]
MTDFQSLGLCRPLLKAVEANGYETPTPIQREAIPYVLKGCDLLGLAQTGTGKTAAFGLPLADRLLADPEPVLPKGTRALILAPTRELVNQIAANIRLFLRQTPISVTSVVGGVSLNPQIKRLSRGTDILVATPGRLLDLVERGAVRLDTASVLVLDEADQMLDLGFIHALRKIAKLVSKQRQTLLFSATMPKQIEDLAATYLTDPVRVEVAPAGRTADKVAQSVHFVARADKTAFLTDLMVQRPDDTALVFCRTKHGAERLMKKLKAAGIAAGSIHGNKSQNQRDRAIRGLRSGEIKVLVATDVAARGIDIPGVSHVYNFDLPDVAEAYVHRIGRTARAGASGDAVTLCGPEEIVLLRQIERLTGVTLTIASGEVPTRPAPGQSKPARPPRRPRSQNGSGEAKTGAKPRRPRNRRRTRQDKKVA